jgi:hypothetical protein
MSETEKYLSYIIKFSGPSRNLGAVFTISHIHNGEPQIYEGFFGKESLISHITNLEREGRDVSIQREALTELRTALVQDTKDRMEEAWLRRLQISVLGNAPGPTANPYDLIQWYEAAMKATLQVQEEAAEMLLARIAAVETVQAQREQAMCAVLKVQEERATQKRTWQQHS